MPQARFEKKMNGYLISVKTETFVRLGHATIKVVTTKTPVMDVYDATVLYMDKVSVDGVSRDIQAEMSKKWVDSLFTKLSTEGAFVMSNPHVQSETKKYTSDILDEYWYEPWTAVQRDEYEKSVGLQKKDDISSSRDGEYTKSPICMHCGERHYEDDECVDEVEGG